MKINRLAYALIAVVFLGGCNSSDNFKNGKYEKEKEVSTFTLSKTYNVQHIEPYTGVDGTAKNIILLIGDGMGTSHVFAGITANEGKTYFQQFHVNGYSRTAAANKYTTDSAAGGTAIATGEKINYGTIGLDIDNKPLETILEIADKKGKATGMVVTSSITHATPASFIAHRIKRNMYEEIAYDFLKTDIDVFIGGGKYNFDKRKDGLNLLDSLKARGYSVIDSEDKILDFKGDKLAGFISNEHPKGVSERGDILVKATSKAIEILSKDKNGFFLMVEGSQIDWAAHENNTQSLLDEVADFDKAIGEALKFAAKDGNTLVIVTADHETGAFTVKDGDDNLGEVKGIFSSKGHSATMVPVFAYGPGAKSFGGIYQNTELFNKMLNAYGFSK